MSTKIGTWREYAYVGGDSRLERKRAIKIFLGIIGAGIVAAVGMQYLSSTPTKTSIYAGLALVEIKLPETLSQQAEIGLRIFEAKCADCHGANAVGQEGVAPPLVHIIYEPNHHGDESFQRAVAVGVRAHHWRFGNMPAVAGLTRADVKDIITYVRELQRENGIL